MHMLFFGEVMKKIGWAVLASMLLLGCSSTPKTSSLIRSGEAAKIRVNHPLNGADEVKIIEAEDMCEVGTKRAFTIDASKSAVARFKASKDLQMPKTDSSSRYYDEFEIPSGHTLSISFATHVQRGNYIESCTPSSVSFVPRSLANYEVSMSTAYGQCQIVVNEIEQDSQGIRVVIVPIQQVKTKRLFGSCR